jgi:hypothetical protein
LALVGLDESVAQAIAAEGSPGEKRLGRLVAARGFGYAVTMRKRAMVIKYTPVNGAFDESAPFSLRWPMIK